MQPPLGSIILGDWLHHWADLSQLQSVKSDHKYHKSEMKPLDKQAEQANINK